MVGSSARRPSNPGKVQVCRVRGCERPRYARGLCQTHHRQLRRTGQLHPIRPYRPRSRDGVKFMGLRLTRRCAAVVKRYAEGRKLSNSAAIVEVLQQWSAGQPDPLPTRCP